MRWRGSRALVLTLLALGAGLMLFPLWWMLVVSLETPTNAGAATVEVGALSLFPADPQWANWVDAMRAVGTVEWEGFLDALANSILVTFLTVTATVLSCSLVGYALARTRFRGRAALFGVMLATMMLPPQVTMIPMFLVFRELGWVDTILPLVVPALFGNAFFVFMFSCITTASSGSGSSLVVTATGRATPAGSRSARPRRRAASSRAASPRRRWTSTSTPSRPGPASRNTSTWTSGTSLWPPRRPASPCPRSLSRSSGSPPLRRWSEAWTTP